MLRLLPILLLIFGVSHAAPLTEDEAEGFVRVLEAMHAYEEENGDLDIDFDMDMEGGNIAETIDMFVDEEGRIVLMSSLSKRISQHPQAGPVFRDAMKKEGFSDLDAFGEVGDRFVAAMMRSEMSKSDLDDMREAANMSPDQLAFIPEPMRPLLKRMAALATTVEAVPASDVALAKKYKPRLEAINDDA